LILALEANTAAVSIGAATAIIKHVAECDVSFPQNLVLHHIIVSLAAIE